MKKLCVRRGALRRGGCALTLAGLLSTGVLDAVGAEPGFYRLTVRLAD